MIKKGSFTNLLGLMLLSSLVLGLLTSRSARAQDGVWGAPINLSSSTTQSDMPAIAADPKGVVHVVWIEETDDGRSFIKYSSLEDGIWIPSNEIMTSPSTQEADYLSLAADSDGYLHLVWRGDATIYYSTAYAPIANLPQSWSTPVALEYIQNGIGQPNLAIDPRNGLHIVYGIKSNLSSRINYLKSTDRGKTWSDPKVIYSTERSDRMVDLPRIAISPDGSLNVIWVEYNYPETFPPIGIRYSSTTGAEDAWSKPISLAEGPYNEPGIVVRGKNEVHVAFSGTGEVRYKFHRWSNDKGQTWSDIYTDTELGGFQGFPALVVDSKQRLHWLMIGTVFRLPYTVSTFEKDSLFHTIWLQNGWSAGEVLLSNTSTRNNPRDVAAVITKGNELHVVWTNTFDDDVQPQGWQGEIYYLGAILDSPGLPGVELPTPTTSPSKEPGDEVTKRAILPTPTLTFNRSPSSFHGTQSPVIAIATIPFVMIVGFLFFIILKNSRNRRF